MPTEEDRRSLKVLHGALCMGCALFLLVLVFLGNMNSPALDPAPALLTPIGLASLLFIGLSFLMFSTRITRMHTTFTHDPFTRLRADLILHWAMIEASCFANAVIFLLNGSWLVCGAALFALAVLAVRRPTDSRVDGWLTGSHG